MFYAQTPCNTNIHGLLQTKGNGPMTHSLTHKNLSVADLDFDHTAGSIGMNGTIYHCLPTLPQLLRKTGCPQCDPRPEPDAGIGLPHRQRGQALQ